MEELGEKLATARTNTSDEKRMMLPTKYEKFANNLNKVKASIE